MDMNKYRVYFNQINQIYIDVNAEDRNDAIQKASREWKRDFALPDIGEVNRLNHKRT